MNGNMSGRKGNMVHPSQKPRHFAEYAKNFDRGSDLPDFTAPLSEPTNILNGTAAICPRAGAIAHCRVTRHHFLALSAAA